MADADWMNLCREKLKEISFSYQKKFDYKVHKEYGISLVMEKERTQVLFPFYTKKQRIFTPFSLLLKRDLKSDPINSKKGERKCRENSPIKLLI